MNTFDFFFGLNLGQRLFSHTDNLSRTLQHTKMSALSGKQVACFTKDVLQKMRNDTSFRSFYDVVLLKSKSYPSMSGPMLPRRTRAPRRIEIGTGEPTYPVTAQDYYRRIYFEAILGFHMTSRPPYWCPQTMKWRPCWCPDPILRELKAIIMLTSSFVFVEKHGC